MQRLYQNTLLAMLLLLGAALAGFAEDPPMKKRSFIGTITVSPNRRAELIEFLKNKGYSGAFIFEGSAPHTLMYRGTQAEFDAALEALNRHLHPEWYAPKVPLPKGKARTAEERDAEENQKLGVSKLQLDLLTVLRKEGKERWEATQKEFGGKPILFAEKGAEHNIWWRGQYQRILTREQYRLWTPSFADIDLGADPKIVKNVPPKEKSDDAIFAVLDLSEKQKEYLSKTGSEIEKARKLLIGVSDARVVLARRAELDQQWKTAIEYALTEKQMKIYLAYWDKQ